ncbi:DUF2637 domain-containing protein [Streptomyces sp. NBC_00687]|uniref:DUF2637 domain-containing protein n=1 Tax=Streptomyces sp. NBC_00687 TaxID=2975807 RepID=UPI0022532539|nr:DUF2637 domain-containing protein [Streptomyces sp. NBC_00687]MCX4919943.1 DUF2637 domain-containing protein [Streptomyces sp. NBC_00687]
MTLTDWPHVAAEPTVDGLTPDTVSGSPEAVSPTQDTVSDAPEFLSEPESGTGPQRSAKGLTTTQKWVAGAIVAAALALAGIGLYLSFEHVARFAHEQLRFESLGKGQLFAVGVDVGIMVMIAVDLLMAWLQRPINWIRYPVWLLTGATVVLNAASGAPEGAWRLLDYVAAGAHGIVPILFIAVVELGRTAIDRIVRPEREERDSIPLIRWILAPQATPKLFRRMKLWGITSYPEMVRRDQQLLAYKQWLTRKYEGDITRATEDERLPMTMAKFGYTVAQALAMPEEQERAAQERVQLAEQRALDAETQREVSLAKSQVDRVRAKGTIDKAQAEVDGETGQARAHARAQVSAAERAAALEEAALESAVIAEARAREAQAEAQEAQEREARAAADLKAAELERQAAEKRRKTEEADRVAAAEAQAVETQAIAEARKATAEADKLAAEDEAATTETLRRAAEMRLRTAREEEQAALASASAKEALAREASAVREAAEARLAAARIEQRAAEIEDTAKLSARQRAARKLARMAFAAGLDPDGLAVEDIHTELRDRVSIAEIQEAFDVSSTDTAFKYRQEAVALIADGYRV